MRLPTKFVVTTLITLNSPAGSSGSLWLKHLISEGLSGTSHKQPVAGCRGVAWASGASRESALALWDRSSARFVIGPPQPAGTRSLIFPPSLDDPSWPSLSNEGIAFEAGPYGAEREIYLWNAGRPHRISYNSTRDAHPSLFEGNIVWDNYPPACSPWPCEPEDSEIWFWNGYGAWQVTDNDIDDAYPSLYELTVAWESDGNIVYATIPDPEWGMALTPTVVAGGQRPSLYAGKIAYQASDGNDSEVFLYDTESQQTQQLTDNEYNDVHPRLYDGTIVWHAYDGNDSEIFYWDGQRTEQLTDNDIWDGDPSLWGTGLNTTIAYVETWWDPSQGIGTLYDRIICLRPAVTASTGPRIGEITVTWPSLEGRTYRVEYSDDLITWRVATESVPSAGYGETSWTDGPTSGTIPPPSEVSRRFYRVCEND